jgi:CheY-like chemotaxis protein
MTAIAQHAPTILLVEDDPTTRRFVRMALEDADYIAHERYNRKVWK